VYLLTFFCLERKQAVRKVIQPTPDEYQPWQPPTLRTTKPAAIYARRCDEKASKKETDKSPSREMQTEDLLAWAQTHASSLADCGVSDPHRLAILRKILHGFSAKERGA